MAYLANYPSIWLEEPGNAHKISVGIACLYPEIQTQELETTELQLLNCKLP
jgi:hypothetical protein